MAGGRGTGHSGRLSSRPRRGKKVHAAPFAPSTDLPGAAGWWCLSGLGEVRGEPLGHDVGTQAHS